MHPRSLILTLLLITICASCSKSERHRIPQNPATFNLENMYLSKYLTEAQEAYTDENWTTVSLITYGKDNSGAIWYNSSSNRKDVPAPVSLNINTGVKGTRKVDLYEDGILLSSSTTKLKTITYWNLTPGSTYYYMVSDKESGDIIFDGQFTTTGRRRMLRVSQNYADTHANNCRDLGGLRTTDGKQLRYGIIYRGTNLDETTSEEKRILAEDLGIKLDVDLRAGGTAAFAGSKWDIGYSLTTYDSWDGSNASLNLKNPDNIKHTFTDIMAYVNDGKPCYIHCAAGADRTGYICMLIEAVLGVSQADCSIDYEITSFSCVGARDRSCTHDDYYFSKGVNYICGYPKGETFQEKAENILLDAGITAGAISKFREVMIED